MHNSLLQNYSNKLLNIGIIEQVLNNNRTVLLREENLQMD